MTDPDIAAMNQPPRLPNLRPARPPTPRAAPVRPVEPVEAPPPAPRPAERAPAARRGGRPRTGRSTVPAGLPVDLAQRMDAAAERAGLSLGDWLMRAANDVWDRLGRVYPPLPKMRPGWPAARRTPRGTVPGGRQVKNFRLTPDQRKILEDGQRQHAVESLSEFVTTVVELALDDVS